MARRAPVQEAVHVLRELRLLPRPNPSHVWFAVAALLAASAVFSGWFELFPSGHVEELTPDEAAAYGVGLVACGLGAMLSWTVMSTLRAASIALVTETSAVAAAVARVRRRVGALVVLGLVLGVLETVAVCPSIVCPASLLTDGLEAEGMAGMQVMLAFGTLFWLLTRSYTGLAVAAVTLEDLSALRALRRSASTLAGHRVAALSTRMVLLPIAFVAITLARVEGWTAWSPLHPAFFVVPVLVMIDAHIEAAWHRHLRPSLDLDYVTDVFR